MWLLGSKISTGENYLRAAGIDLPIRCFRILCSVSNIGPNEIRCVARESLGFYRSLVVGGVYDFVKPVDIKSTTTYNHALRCCIDSHPRLSAIIAGRDTDSPYFEFCPRMDLSQHVQFLRNDIGKGESEAITIQRALPSTLDEFLPTSIPPWKIVLLPLSDNRCFIAFSYSHALGDGLSGCAFHRTFLEALQDQRLETDLICTPTRKELSPPFDTPENLPISWTYLLSPFLGQYLPTYLSSLFGFSSNMNAATPSTWTGTPVFYDPETLRTGVEMISIESDKIEDALKLCRMNGAKLTGLLHQFFLDALSEALPRPHNFDSLGGGTAINMRPTVGVSNDEMGVFASGDFQMYPLQVKLSGGKEQFSWSLAKEITDRLAVRSKEIQDQPLGLLRYLLSIRAWTLSKIGGRREDSYAISNLMRFQPLGNVDNCAVTEVIFCQPTDVAGGAALSINIISIGDGPMNITVNWQAGGLDLGTYEDEVEFVRTVCRHVEIGFARLCTTLDVSEKRGEDSC